MQQRRQALLEMRAGVRGMQAEKILPFSYEDDDADARGKTDNHRIRDVLDRRPEFGGTHDQQNDSRHKGRDLQTADTMLRGNDREHGDESTRGSGDLHTGTAEQRCAKAGHDGRVEPLFRSRARSHRECHAERKRDDADDDTCNDIAAEVRPGQKSRAVTFEYRDHAAASPCNKPVTYRCLRWGLTPQVTA